MKVDAAHLDTPVYIPYKKVDDTLFFNVSKKDRKVERLLVKSLKRTPGDGGETLHRPLAKTSILEDIKKKRDAAFWEAMNVGEHHSRTARKKQEAQILVLEDAIHTVELPAIGHLEAKSLKVLLAKPHGKDLSRIDQRDS